MAGTDTATDQDGWIPVEGVGEPDETMHVRDLDAMLEITNPKRGMLLRHLRHPRSAAEIAEEMGVPVTRLYHHINRLHDHGIIRVVATRQVAAVTERRYQVTARSFRPDDDLLARSDRSDVARVLGSVFDAAKVGFMGLVEQHGPMALRDEDDSLALSLAELQIRPERRRDLVRRLEALFADFSESDDETDDAERVTLFIACFVDPSDDAPG